MLPNHHPRTASTDTLPEKCVYRFRRKEKSNRQRNARSVYIPQPGHEGVRIFGFPDLDHARNGDVSQQINHTRLSSHPLTTPQFHDITSQNKGCTMLRGHLNAFRLQARCVWPHFP